MENLPPDLRAVLPPATQEAWLRIAAVVPRGGYLAGGTAIAVHLGHRISRDLDFFLSEPFDPDLLARQLIHAGDFAPTLTAPGTLNGMFGRTKVQFLDARTQRVLGPLNRVAGIDVADLCDLLATKLKVIGDRGELRDYFDIEVIEESTTLTVEQGIALYVARYRPDPPEPSVAHIVRALGYLDDVADDPSLPVPRARIADYWSRRQDEIAGALDPAGRRRAAGTATPEQIGRLFDEGPDRDPAPVSTRWAMRPRAPRRSWST